MNRSAKFDPVLLAMFLGFCLLIAGLVAIRYCWVSWQAEVWRKQGVQITNTEAFFGITPAGALSK